MVLHKWSYISVLAAALFAGTAGCALQPAEEQGILAADPELLSGQAVFGETVSFNEAPAADVLAMTPAMHALVADIADEKLAVVRFRKLLSRLEDAGYFGSIYAASVTQTAADTFNTKIGNCISYTNLFVALARAANLRVSYQIVEVEHPAWNADTGLLIRNNHINLLVQISRLDRSRTSGYTIDFNLIDPDPEAQVALVSDAYALSLFYANLSVDELMRGNNRLSFAFLLRGIDTEPRNPDLWINLGAFYGRHQQHALALRAYLIAQQLNPQEKIVWSGIERSYRALGQIDQADQLARKVRRYREQNPFYYFAVAQTAYDAQDYQSSLSAIERAIKLKRRNPRFFYMRSLVQRQLGDEEAAERSLSKAKRYGRYDDLKRRYGALELSMHAG